MQMQGIAENSVEAEPFHLFGQQRFNGAFGSDGNKGRGFYDTMRGGDETCSGGTVAVQDGEREHLWLENEVF